MHIMTHLHTPNTIISKQILVTVDAGPSFIPFFLILNGKEGNQGKIGTQEWDGYHILQKEPCLMIIAPKERRG